MRSPYQPSLEGVDIGLIGVPFDGGVTNRTGTRHGPREIRNQSSLMRSINQGTGVAPFELCSVADIGDALPESPFELEKSHRSIQAFFEKVVGADVVEVAPLFDPVGTTVLVGATVMFELPRIAAESRHEHS